MPPFASNILVHELLWTIPQLACAQEGAEGFSEDKLKTLYPVLDAFRSITMKRFAFFPD